MEKSTELGELAKALCKFQKSINTIEYDSDVTVQTYTQKYTFKYASLCQIMEKIKIPLTDVGLSITQLLIGRSEIQTILLHESGQFISSVFGFDLPPKYNKDGKQVNYTAQDIGGYMTYARRYALSAILGIVTDEDTDANLAIGNDLTKRDIKNEPREMKKITPEQLQSWKRGIMQGKSIIDALAKYEEMFIVEKKVIEELKQTSLEYEALSNEEEKKQQIIKNTQNNE